MNTVVLTVPNMDCAGCLITIRMAVSQLLETAEVSGDFASRELTVEYNSSEVTVEEIQQTLASVGYESSILDNPVVP